MIPMIARIEDLPLSAEEVRQRMQEMNISEELFTAEEFYYHYDARNWVSHEEPIMKWSSLLRSWEQYRLKQLREAARRTTSRKAYTAKKSSRSQHTAQTAVPTATVQPTLQAPQPQQTDEQRTQEVDTWLECQFPMPEEPTKQQQSEKLLKTYSLQHQKEFGVYDRWYQIMTSNTITLRAAERVCSSDTVMRLLVMHIDDLARHFHTTLLSYPLDEMAKTARWIIRTTPDIRIAELMLIFQLLKEELKPQRCGLTPYDIKQRIQTYPQWRHNTLTFWQEREKKK